jgi:MoxR-like ATPase/flagellin-specific chaperone FliS
MAENNQNTQPTQLEGGTYEIIRNRLQKQGTELRTRLTTLNDARKEVFGAIETQLISNDRISTSNNCIARDIVAIGDISIFGYNVHIGLRSGIKLADVFSIYEFRDNGFHVMPLDLLKDEKFEVDFHNLYRYYKNTTFSKFAVIGSYLYMVFQVSEKISDIKTFKWLIKDGKLTYVDNRSDHEYQFPNQFEFKWERARRDMQRMGQHPHISILDKVFVETVGGDLTIKVEDNTDDGYGIYREDVEFPDQTLDDAEFFYADLGNLIALKIKPFREEARYFIYNDKTQEVKRIDALEDSGVLLPDNHGLMFSNGYYLQTGEFKIFDVNRRGKHFERRIASPNGEDHLYVFYSKAHGRYVLMSYNVIAQTVTTPILCHGFTLFPNGELCYFKAEDEPTKHHVVQIWQTPYVTGDFIPSEHTESYLYKVGNKDIVRAMAECHAVLTLLNKEDSYSGLYLELSKKATDILDAYYWIDKEDGFLINEPLVEIRKSANAAIEEFEKVQRIKKNTKEEIGRVRTNAEALFSRVTRTTFDVINEYVDALSELRVLRGEIISLRDLRYTDLELIEKLEAQAIENTDKLSQGCVEFLLDENALIPYIERVETARGEIDNVQTAVQANELGGRIDQIGEDLKLMIDIVSNLKIEDATQTTRIIDNISNIYTTLNQIKAALKRRQKSLMSKEAVAEFAAQLKLIDQSIINYLDISDTPDKCDDYLTKLMVQLEELEGKFVEFDEFIGQLTEKREEIYNAFETRKLNLVEARNRRAASLQSAAERILNGVKNRVSNFKEVSEINGFFASDLMIDKVRDIITQLTDLEDSVKAGDIQSQLKTLKEDAIRQLRDKKDLFVDGKNIIRFGKHHFSVNTQPLDLTMVNRSGEMYFHLTGTNFFEKVADEGFNATKSVWEQTLISENDDVYRAEYLAYMLFKSVDDNPKAKAQLLDDLKEKVKAFSATRYHEGYTKGIHDEDAAMILKEILELTEDIDLLRYPSVDRAAAQLFWNKFISEIDKENLNHQLKSAGAVLNVFPNTHEFDYLLDELESQIQASDALKASDASPEQIAKYLFDEWTRGDKFIISKEAAELHNTFLQFLVERDAKKAFNDSVKSLGSQPVSQFLLIKKWVQAFIDQLHVDHYQDFLEETSTLLLLNSFNNSQILDISTRVELKGLHGSHSVITNTKYLLDYNHFITKMERYENTVVPMFNQFNELKKSLNSQFRKDLRLEEFKPRVLSSFVRNQLIDKVYLPIFGDNLAKQIGTVGENTRTDRMGMLLLISPPGYGKTTLMEYIASRLGLIFMKINGPAIGHTVTSLDPSEANNAAARQELQKLNLALEMGDNIMLYLDDIQHCNPEFLQKFISLTDAQRKIEGVYKGQTKTYDLRGKKVCVVMAGNPYTESGEKFQVPDMLANRADIYNLGDIIGDTREVFALSYIENALTSNTVLQKLASKSMKDVYSIIKYAETDSRDGLDFEANHAAEELTEYTNVLKKMLTVRDVIFRVNMEYIASAAQADDYRVEPPFLLQGSYRNMGKLAEKIVPIMNEQELQTLLLSHYEGEAQTLTTGTEANLLKFKELNGWLTDEDTVRWEEIKTSFNKNKRLKGMNEGDPMVQVLGQLSAFVDGIEGIREVLERK